MFDPSRRGDAQLQFEIRGAYGETGTPTGQRCIEADANTCSSDLLSGRM